MLGDLAHVLLPELRIVHQHVGTDAAGHEDLAHLRERAQGAQQVDLARMVGAQRRAGGRHAALVGTGAVLELLGALDAQHVGRRAADVGDDALPFRMGGHALGLGDDRLVGAGLDDAALVRGDRAEVALAVAAVVREDREADGLQRLDRPLGRVQRMRFALPGLVVIERKFVGRERHVGHVLHQVPERIGLLRDPLAGDRILVHVEAVEHLDELALVRHAFLVRGQLDVAFGHGLGLPAQALEV